MSKASKTAPQPATDQTDEPQPRRADDPTKRNGMEMRIHGALEKVQSAINAGSTDKRLETIRDHLNAAFDIAAEYGDDNQQ